MTTKSARIMELHARGLSTREIALEVYGPDCNLPTKMAYVRIVTRQRKSGYSQADIKYLQGNGREVMNARSRRRYASDPAFRNKRNAIAMRWQKANRERWNEIKRASYARAKERSCAELTNQ